MTNRIQELLDATNGGLDIILKYYPQAKSCVQNPNRKFKIRDEKTPSASIKQLENGRWILTDFGGDGIAKDAIKLAVEFTGNNLIATLDILCNEFIAPRNNNIATKTKKVANLKKAQIKKIRLLTENEIFTAHASLSDWNNEMLLPIFSQAILSLKNCNEIIATCKEYQFFPVESYQFEKNETVWEVSSSSDNPIYAWVIESPNQTHFQIYQPLGEKKYRFRWLNGRPKGYVFGLKQCECKWENLRSNETIAESDEGNQPINEDKLDRIILCSGGTDALNLAAIGYSVIWLNSETSKYEDSLHQNLLRMACNISIAYDIDETGIRKSHEMNSEYVEMCTLKLPFELLHHKDKNGNPCKDIRDFFNHYKIQDFKSIIAASKPYRFWNEKKTRNGVDYSFNMEYLLYFLERHGFCQVINNPGSFLARIENHIVTIQEPKAIRSFILDFLRRLHLPSILLDKFHRQVNIFNSVIDSLTIRELNFKSGGSDYQILHFQNASVKITKYEVKILKPNEINHFVLSTSVIPHEFSFYNRVFKADFNEGYKQLIELDPSSIVYQFVKDTCNVHWRVNEEGKDQNGIVLNRNELSDSEEFEILEHLFNRLYSIGYLLHNYKDRSNSSAVLIIENNIVDSNQSEGGSGKSLIADLIKCYASLVMIPSRNMQLFRNNHVRENITENTSVIVFDDCYKGFPFTELFSDITNSMLINPKGKKSFELSFENSPKIMLTSNYPLGDLDGSTQRRLLVNGISNYYHHHNKKLCLLKRTPFDRFGLRLFQDFSREEWAKTHNFIIDCIRLYLSAPSKLEAPGLNHELRNLMNRLHEEFKDWADMYFSADSGNLNRNILKTEALEAYNQLLPGFKIASAKFKKQLELWCRVKGFDLNPKSMANQDGRIIQRDVQSKKVSEFIYVSTHP